VRQSASARSSPAFPVQLRVCVSAWGDHDYPDPFVGPLLRGESRCSIGSTAWRSTILPGLGAKSAERLMVQMSLINISSHNKVSKRSSGQINSPLIREKKTRSQKAGTGACASPARISVGWCPAGPLHIDPRWGSTLLYHLVSIRDEGVNPSSAPRAGPQQHPRGHRSGNRRRPSHQNADSLHWPGGTLWIAPRVTGGG